MSSAHQLSSFSSLLGSIHKGLDRYLPESSDKGRVLAESSALLQLSSASLKNVAYAFFEEGFSLLHMLTSRVTFLEAGINCAVSAITNLFFALAYTGLNVVTLGLSFALRTRCKIHWMHVVYGAITTAISAVGVLSPYYGIGINGYWLAREVRTIQEYYQEDISRSERHLVRYVQELTKEHKQYVYSFMNARHDNWKYDEQVKPSLDQIEARIHSATRMDDLITLAEDIFTQWPKMAKRKDVQSR